MPLKEKLPNQIFYLGMISAEEILGLNGLNSILNYAKLQKFIGNYPPNNLELEQTSEDFTRLMAGFIEVLGERGSKSITFQLGKRSFEIILEQFPSLLNIDGITPDERTPGRLFDEFVRLQGIMFVAAEHLFGDIYTCYENDEGYVIELSPCYWCRGLKTGVPICNAGNGFSHAIARWIVGQDLRIDETLCIARGDDRCRHVIYRPGR
jgi:predicted hydrocarbon binding protein